MAKMAKLGLTASNETANVESLIAAIKDCLPDHGIGSRVVEDIGMIFDEEDTEDQKMIARLARLDAIIKEKQTAYDAIEDTASDDSKLAEKELRQAVANKDYALTLAFGWESDGNRVKFAKGSFLDRMDRACEAVNGQSEWIGADKVTMIGINPQKRTFNLKRARAITRSRKFKATNVDIAFARMDKELFETKPTVGVETGAAHVTRA